jgi:hypothetical protein
MSDTAIAQQLRRLREKTWPILNKESDYVGSARGKAADICDIICFGKLGYRLIKVCLDTISKAELDRLLNFNECRDPSTIIQIFFWHKHDHRPFYLAKLYYARPDQPISATLKKLVK